MKNTIIGLAIILAASASAQWSVVYLGGGSASRSNGAHGGQQVGDAGGGGDFHAVLWAGSQGSMVDLHPPGYWWSFLTGVHNGQQVGVISQSGSWGDARATRWNGTAGSHIVLHPVSQDHSAATGTNGSVQVGGSGTSGIWRACKWAGTAASWQSIHPAHATTSGANGCDADQIVGSWNDNTGYEYACLLDPYVSLHPVSADESRANAVEGGQQVGWVDIGIPDEIRASLWTGSSGSWVDLHPAGSLTSAAMSVYKGRQVGYVKDGSNTRGSACLWFGTAGSMVNLHVFLTGFRQSEANGVWVIGDRTEVSGWGVTTNGERYEALMWVSRSVAPTSYSMFRGSVFSGNLASLLNSDNDRLVMRPGITLGTSQPPIQIFLNATAPTASPNGFSFSLESSASFGNAQQKISLYNFNSGLYEELDARLAKTTDDTVTVTVRTNPSRFIEPGTLAIRARVSFRAVGPSLAFPWSGRIDKVWWNFPG